MPVVCFITFRDDESVADCLKLSRDGKLSRDKLRKAQVNHE